MNMPIGLRVKSGIVFALGTKEKRRAMMRELGARRRYTQPRESIPWHPRIDAGLCTGCGVCLAFCPKGVFGREPAQAVVENPASCVLLCSRCAKRCPAGAIAFPRAEEFRKYVYYV